MVVATAIQSETPIDAAGLEELMRSFNAVTEQLVSTHGALQSQVTSLKGELAEANARLRRTEALAALGEMAAGIAHEIRNPLGSIRLYTQVLRDEVEGRNEARRLCERIEAATIRLDEVVREVLAFARHTDLRVQPHDPQEILDRALCTCEALLIEHGVTVERCAADTALPALEVDAGLLVSALANIVRNAAEAMAEAGSPTRRLVVRAGRCRRRRPNGSSGGFVVVSFEDTGPGIPSDVVPRLFNPFYTTRANGTGLGLSIVHRVVDAHGGHIDVGTTPEGGARFEVFIPEDGPPAAMPADHDAESNRDATDCVAREAC
ncbi:MAG: hypothetical protein KDA22_01805 [Phycisphaerales bacterium]|nr:hypothetical protein [Phycisphaerales bacterium]